MTSITTNQSVLWFQLPPVPRANSAAKHSFVEEGRHRGKEIMKTSPNVNLNFFSIDSGSIDFCKIIQFQVVRD